MAPTFMAAQTMRTKFTGIPKFKMSRYNTEVKPFWMESKELKQRAVAKIKMRTCQPLSRFSAR